MPSPTVYKHNENNKIPILTFLNNINSKLDWNLEIIGSKIRVFNYLIGLKYIVKQGDLIYYDPDYKHQEPPINNNITTIYEDSYIFVLNKPPNMPVHPCGAYKQNTLTSLLHSKGFKYHLIHRLDLETSGIIIMAKKQEYANIVSLAYAKSQKIYLTCIHGQFPKRLSIKGKLGPKIGSKVRKKRGFNTREGKMSYTRFYCIKRGNGLSLLYAMPRTGRMHQIRAHLSEKGYPVFGDKIYGLDDTFFITFLENGLTAELQAKIGFPRQFLHCWKNYFYHPYFKKKMIFKAIIPADINNCINKYFN